ncbi:hypothetical protein K449DRAFT_431198 [Hypoxylon sp. EC38]|nr:hypothetical protein K449DRAFT_431198 [Hypoxylon sp. EC38]
MSSTLLPFLYHTRTILRANPRTTTAFARALHATSRHLRKDDIPFASEIGEENIPSEPASRGTITPSERQIFERIFADIKARGLKPAFEDNSPTAAATRSTMLIMNQAAHDAGQARPSTIAAPGLLAGAARDRNKALLRFPPELRAAASRALGAIQATATATVTALPNGDDIAYDEASIKQGDVNADEGWTTPPHIINRTVELEAKRHPERTRVEGLIAAAKSDFELWDVLENEVFTMPSKLGLGTIASEQEKKQPAKPRGRKKKESAPDETASDETASNETAPDETAPDETANSSDEASAAVRDAEVPENIVDEVDGNADDGYTPPQKLSLYIHGPLYPAYLLLALRRLDTAFRAPSPLAFSILPRIKELGLESYILGVSTPFYNELLRIYWARRGDLIGMLNLLEEMRHCGLYFDNQTASILNHVDSTVDRLANNKSSGSFGRALMTMPEYGRPVRDRIRHWHRAVDLSIQERENDIGY